MLIQNFLDTNVTKNSVISIGNFDGIHKGHKKILDSAYNLAKKNDLVNIVLTFKTHKNLLNNHNKNLLLISNEQKTELLKQSGVDILIYMNFTKVSHISASEFCNILANKFRAKYVVVGSNFKFGYNRKGDTQLLTRNCKFKTKIIAINKDNNVSSTKIRNLIKNGDVAEANIMLNRYFTIRGTVENGTKIGSKQLKKTINIDIEQYIPPKLGAYITQIRLLGEKNWFNAVSNIGISPTVKNTKTIKLETHILSKKFDQITYHKRVDVRLLSFLREEKKFTDIIKLREAILIDINRANNFFNNK